MSLLPSVTLMLVLISSGTGGMDVPNDGTDIPPCDTKVVGEEALKKYFPSGPPENLAQIVKKNSPYSFIVLSKPNAEVPEVKKDAECVSVAMADVNAATLTKHYYVNQILVPQSTPYTVTQKDYYLEYQHKNDKHPYRIYPLFFKNNVLITYKCCEKCGGKTLNVGVAVPDKMRDDSATKATVAEAKKKLQDYQLDGNVRTLIACPDVKNKKE